MPGTESFIDPGHAPALDRIGGPGGEYFANDGATMGERALPPDRLNFPRTHWEIDNAHRSLADGAVRIEQSQVAPWFGQEGGGQRFRFLDADGNAISQGQLADMGIIRQTAEDSSAFDWGAAVTGGLTIHGLESLDRFVATESRGR